MLTPHSRIKFLYSEYNSAYYPINQFIASRLGAGLETFINNEYVDRAPYNGHILSLHPTPSDDFKNKIESLCWVFIQDALLKYNVTADPSKFIEHTQVLIKYDENFLLKNIYVSCQRRGYEQIDIKYTFSVTTPTDPLDNSISNISW